MQRSFQKSQALVHGGKQRLNFAAQFQIPRILAFKEGFPVLELQLKSLIQDRFDAIPGIMRMSAHADPYPFALSSRYNHALATRNSRCTVLEEVFSTAPISS